MWHASESEAITVADTAKRSKLQAHDHRECWFPLSHTGSLHLGLSAHLYRRVYLDNYFAIIKVLSITPPPRVFANCWRRSR